MRIRLHPPTEIVCGFCCLLALALLYRFSFADPLLNLSQIRAKPRFCMWLNCGLNPVFPKFVRSSWSSVSLILDMVLAVFVAAEASISVRWTVYRMKGKEAVRGLRTGFFVIRPPSCRVVFLHAAHALALLHRFFDGEA